MPPLLALHGISKSFGAIVANRDITLSLEHGEVLGVLGENGAGKSTLMNILSGLLQPDAGEIRFAGEAVRFASPRDALGRGIGMVHQRYMLVPTLSVTENIALGDDRAVPWRPRLRIAAQRIAKLGAELGLPIDPDAKVATLDVGSRQRVEILKALFRGVELLILDEPTTVLSETERAQLYAFIRRLKASGVTVILISHKLDDIFAVCDRVVVLRAGLVVDAAPLAGRSPEALVRSMIGEDLAARPPAAAAPGAVVLAVRDLAMRRDAGGLAFAGVSFERRAGEILGLCGVEGNGQYELAEAIAGLRPLAAGSIALDGRALTPGVAARERRRRGIRPVPHDRHASGMLERRPLSANFLLSHGFDPAFAGRIGLRRRAARGQLGEIARHYRLHAPAGDVAIAALSGGNQQKLVVGRELWGHARVLIAAHATRGLDVRTVAFLHDSLRRKRASGLAILLITADLAEAWEVADRIMVLAQGRLKGPVAMAETTVQQVGSWIAGR